MSDSLHASGNQSSSRSHSLAPDLPPIATIEQTGGGHRVPSLPPVQTPTCLWSTIRATSCDNGTVQKAQDHHCMLLPQLPVTGDEGMHNDCDDDPFVVEPLVSLRSPVSMHQATPDRTKGSYILMDHMIC